MKHRVDVILTRDWELIGEKEYGFKTHEPNMKQT